MLSQRERSSVRHPKARTISAQTTPRRTEPCQALPHVAQPFRALPYRTANGSTMSDDVKSAKLWSPVAKANRLASLHKPFANLLWIRDLVFVFTPNRD